MVFIRLVASAGERKLVARNARHGIEHALVRDPPRAQLGIDHRMP
jgi:hypothetical protein